MEKRLIQEGKHFFVEKTISEEVDEEKFNNYLADLKARVDTKNKELAELQKEINEFESLKSSLLSLKDDN